jgi:hypothetical protein
MNPLVSIIEVVEEKGHVSFVIFRQIINDRVLFVDLNLDEASWSLNIFTDGLKLWLSLILGPFVFFFKDLIVNIMLYRS